MKKVLLSTVTAEFVCNAIDTVNECGFHYWQTQTCATKAMQDFIKRLTEELKNKDVSEYVVELRPRCEIEEYTEHHFTFKAKQEALNFAHKHSSVLHSISEYKNGEWVNDLY